MYKKNYWLKINKLKEIDIMGPLASSHRPMTKSPSANHSFIYKRKQEEKKLKDGSTLLSWKENSAQLLRVCYSKLSRLSQKFVRLI